MNNVREIVSLINNSGKYYGDFRACSEVRNEMNQADVYGELGFYLNYANIHTEEEKQAFLEILKSCSFSPCLSIDAIYLNNPEVMEAIKNSDTIREIRIINEGYKITRDVFNQFRNKNIAIVCDEASEDLEEEIRKGLLYNLHLQKGIYKREFNLFRGNSNYGFFIDRELTDSELNTFVSEVNKVAEYYSAIVSLRVYDPKKYKNFISRLQMAGLNDNVTIQFLGNPLYDKEEDYKGLDALSNNPISIIYDTCSDMIDQYQTEPFTVDNSHCSELEGGGTTTFDSYFHTIKMLSEQERHIKEKDYSPLETMVYGYRYLQQNYAYDPNIDETDAISYLTNRQLDAVANRKTIVCVGYATLYSALMRRCGLPVFRYATDEHVRNIGRLVDPKYGIDAIGVIDPTWDCSSFENGRFVEKDNFNYFMFSPKQIDRLDSYVTIPYSLVIDNDAQIDSFPYSDCYKPLPRYFSAVSRDPIEVYRDPIYFPEGYASTMLELMGFDLSKISSPEEYKEFLRSLNKTSIFNRVQSETIGEAYKKVIETEHPKRLPIIIQSLVSKMKINRDLNHLLHKPLKAHIMGVPELEQVPCIYDFEETLNIEDFNKKEDITIEEPILVADFEEISPANSFVYDWESLPDDEYLSAEDSLKLAQERGMALVSGGRYHINYLTDEEKKRYHIVPKIDWESLPDDEYLSAEDSLKLAQERGMALITGGRYHISYLTKEEKKRYGVAQKIDWKSLPDDEYLSAEDSLRLAQERGMVLTPGGRYHISYLTEEEKKRYKVAAADEDQDGVKMELDFGLQIPSSEMDGGMSL